MISRISNTDFRLDGKIAVITGAASGIGLAIAELFAQKGAVVCLCDRQKEKLAQIAQRIPGATAYSVDISDSCSISSMLEAILEKHHQIDILINSAGVGDIDWAEDMTEETWRKVIDINLTGTFLTSQAIGKIMVRAKQGGKIISLASQAGLVSIDKHVAYSASKAGIISMTKSLAYEWGKYGIQVNAISPTATETPIIHGYWDEKERMKKTLEGIPAGRYCKPVEVACAALFLASESSNMITGENLVIDGGYTIH